MIDGVSTFLSRLAHGKSLQTLGNFNPKQKKFVTLCERDFFQDWGIKTPNGTTQKSYLSNSQFCDFKQL